MKDLVHLKIEILFRKSLILLTHLKINIKNNFKLLKINFLLLKILEENLEINKNLDHLIIHFTKNKIHINLKIKKNQKEKHLFSDNLYIKWIANLKNQNSIQN